MMARTMLGGKSMEVMSVLAWVLTVSLVLISVVELWIGTRSRRSTTKKH